MVQLHEIVLTLRCIRDMFEFLQILPMFIEKCNVVA
jgi:hypothetical protein